MKTTNILLGIIAVLLFLNLTKNSSFGFISHANAQTNKPKDKLNAEVINVRIVSIDDNAVMNILPKKDFENRYEVFPVVVVNAQDRFKLNVPVYQVNK